MKALEKDRTRRYETANGLMMDLQRHLKNEPVLARPPSNLYRLQKTVRRNKLAFAAVGAVAWALVLGTVVSTWQAIRAGRAEREQSRLHTNADNAFAGEAKQRALAEQRLYHSLVGEAGATRTARRVGYRAEVFRLLEKAPAFEPRYRQDPFVSLFLSRLAGNEPKWVQMSPIPKNCWVIESLVVQLVPNESKCAN